MTTLRFPYIATIEWNHMQSRGAGVEATHLAGSDCTRRTLGVHRSFVSGSDLSNNREGITGATSLIGMEQRPISSKEHPDDSGQVLPLSVKAVRAAIPPRVLHLRADLGAERQHDYTDRIRHDGGMARRHYIYGDGRVRWNFSIAGAGEVL